jgi:pimeloyl-ACP methyl ester carboxylesterase
LTTTSAAPARWSAWSTPASSAHGSYFFADELPALAAWQFGPAEAARVAAPALLISGAETRPWFRENVAILAEMLPDGRTETLPGLDHLAPLTDPAEFARTIGEFVSHLTPTPSSRHQPARSLTGESGQFSGRKRSGIA